MDKIKKMLEDDLKRYTKLLEEVELKREDYNYTILHYTSRIDYINAILYNINKMEGGF